MEIRDHQPVCWGTSSYRGQAMLHAEIDNLKATLGGDDVVEGFMTSTAPGDIVYPAPNDYYQNEEDCLKAIADAMKEEYRATVDAGLLVRMNNAIDPRPIDISC